MKLFSRLQNLWRLSEFELPEVAKAPIEETKVVTGFFQKPRQNATFITYEKISPIKRIVEEVS